MRVAPLVPTIVASVIPVAVGGRLRLIRRICQVISLQQVLVESVRVLVGRNRRERSWDGTDLCGGGVS